ncbi:MAG TPA: replicative DNA helicase [Candidatus Hydrogenedentes bacterium]|jgi:replicative DNA helicase|nr:replicative DNA helicase [Candidatus Hydrogenedentota bacterium]HOD94430.1 replicative DNA helicase [Candidatus Hydrogenedentota bacterium]HOH42389.1 replicative DNA helicase [Candidatus Hydrogenedentota bacterium]HOR50109.1 replicative DNA helicase [Candidatus Hydrogenedentota bacterium]HPK24194.1 replicative DNA helicase [Candidatus Hydrogenedentota bacterium]
MLSESDSRSGAGATLKAHYDRTPPQDVEAERAVLGAILLRPSAISAVLEILHGGETGVFFIPVHQVIFNALIALFTTGRAIDRVTVMSEIGVNPAFDSAGGEAYLTDLIYAVPTSANVEYYAEIVQEKALRRRLIEMCAQVTSESYRTEQRVEDLLDVAEQQIFSLNQQRHTNKIYSISALLGSTIELIEKNLKAGEHITGLATGFHGLDNLLSGLQPSDMVILAARPSVGKTALALNIAANAATRNDKSVLIFSLEMAKEQLTHRMMCMVGTVDAGRLRKGFLSDHEFPKVQKAAGILAQAKIFIDESAGLTPLDLRSKARRFASQNPLDLIIIDYMQLMHTSGRNENRQTEISEISRSIKGLARELSIPILTLSQLSREADKDDGGSPKLSHLRESGAIEQDADVVIILSRPPASDREGKENMILATVAKHRNGPTGRVDLIFQSNYQRFVDADTGYGAQRAAREDTYSAPADDYYADPIMEAPFSEDDEEIF